MQSVVARLKGLFTNQSSSVLLPLKDNFGLFVNTIKKRFFIAGAFFLITGLLAGIAHADEETGQADADSETEEADAQEDAEEAQRSLDQFLRDQFVLIRRGEIELEFNAFYLVDEANNLRLSERFGDRFQDLVTPKFTTRSADTSLLVRYGLWDDFELNFTIPYIYIDQEANFAPFRVDGGESPFIQESNSGLGDISGELRYTVWHEKSSWPTTTLNLIAKSRTGDEDKSLGSGHWNVGGGFNLVKTIDPVVLFGSLGYTYTKERNRNDPGDRILYSLGMGFSLNDRVSWSMRFAGAAVRRDEIDGETIKGSNEDLNSLQFSVTLQLARRFFAEPRVGFGITEDATDFIGGVNISYRLENRFPYDLF